MKSIRFSFSLLVIAAVLICVITLGAISVYYIIRSGNEYSNELLRVSCAGTEKQVDAYFTNIEQCVDTVSYSVSNSLTEISDEAIHDYLNDAMLLFHSVISNTDGVASYYYRIDPNISRKEHGFWFSENEDGDFVQTEMTEIGAYDQDDTEHVGWFYIPQKYGRAMWIEPYVNQNLGNTKMISYVSPAYWNGKFIGVVGIDYDYETFTKNLEYKGTFENAYTVLRSSKGDIIYHSDPERGDNLDELSRSLSKRDEYRDSILYFTNNDQKLRACRKVLSNNMTFYLIVPENDINSTWRRMTSYFVFFAMLIAFLFAVITSFMAGRITEPLSKLTEAAKKIDAGDYNVELNYSGENEVGVLSGVFRQLVQHLSSYITDLNDKAYKDALTSVRNKAAFNMYLQKLDDLIESSGEGAKPEFAICVFDCNDLKDINDRYGHDKGDKYIRKSCGLICDVFKHSPVFRLGGDEFACILENGDLLNRWELCAEFDTKCVHLTNNEEEPWEKISIASGIAIYNPEVDKSCKDVFRRADMRMYEDKERKKAGIETVKITEVEY